MNMKNLILVLALTGCGGESFTGFTPVDPATTDDGGIDSKIAAGGGQDEDDGGAIRTETGGSTSTGGVGGATVGTGGTVVATGGATSTGGASGTGGTTACTPVTHDNGLGQTWQDCVPLGTYNEGQAMKACAAWCAVKNCASSCALLLDIGSYCGVSGIQAVHAGSTTWVVSSTGAVVNLLTSCTTIGTWN